MLKEIQKLPIEMQKAYKKLPNRPDKNTPDVILNFMTDDREESINNYLNPFKVNEIIDFADKNLLDLELDDKTDNPKLYNDFAIQIVTKIMSTIDLETGKSKALKFYDDNKKITRLKARDFTTIGDLKDKLPLETADILAKFYGVENDLEYLELTSWEKRLFADKVISRQKIDSEKN